MKKNGLRLFSILTLVLLLLNGLAAPGFCYAGEDRRVVRVGYFPFDGYHMRAMN